jgi:hypothetical protein
MGDVLSFPGGDVTHGGDPLLSGTRYIIAVFLLLEAGEGEKEGHVKGDGEGEGEVKVEGDGDGEGEGEVEVEVEGDGDGEGEGEVEVEGKGEGQSHVEKGGENEGERYATTQNGKHRNNEVKENARPHCSVDAEQMLQFIGSYLSLYTLDDSFSFSSLSLPTQPQIAADLSLPADTANGQKSKQSICDSVPENKELFSFCFDSFE